jgi:hypothetical protein
MSSARLTPRSATAVPAASSMPTAPGTASALAPTSTQPPAKAQMA